MSSTACRLDFGSGYGALENWKSCDITSSPVLDYYYLNGRITCDDGTFDHIRCRNVIHHVPDFLELSREFYRGMKSGGKLIIIDCNKKNYRKNVILDNVWYRYVFDRRADIEIFPEYRDYFEEFSHLFTLISRKEHNEKEISLWQKG